MNEESVERDGKYMISIHIENEPTLVVRATEDQKQRIRDLTPDQLKRFRHIMGA